MFEKDSVLVSVYQKSGLLNNCTICAEIWKVVKLVIVKLAWC